MNISSDVMKNRRKMASDLQKLANVLYEYFPTAEISSIQVAITQLKDNQSIPQIPREDTNSNYWGYNLNSLIFKFEKTPDYIFPVGCKDLKIMLDVKAIGDCNDLRTLNDPFKLLEFNIVIEGTRFADKVGKQLTTSYHLDKHLQGVDDGEPEFPHPIYHFQFGGRKLMERKELDTGDLLVLDSPRIGHYPMEAILGIDFVLSNFFPNRWLLLRTECPEYINLIEEYQDLILKPYVHTHASKWQYSHDTIVNNDFWNHALICPQLI